MKNPITQYPALALLGSSLMSASLLSLMSPTCLSQDVARFTARGIASTSGETVKNESAQSNATNPSASNTAEQDPLRKLPKYTEFSLGEFDPSLSQVRLKAAISSEQKKAIYNLEGDICSNCIGLVEVPIAASELENLEFLKRQLAKSALEQIRAQKINDSKKTNPSKSTPVNSALCDQDLEDGKLSCVKDHLLEVSSQCESLKEQSKAGKKQSLVEGREQKKAAAECRKQVLQIYRKELRPSLNQALSYPSGSELYNEALETLSDLIRDLPSGFDSSIRKDLLILSQQNALSKTYQNYELSKNLGAAPGYAATLAKQQLAFEMNHYSPMSLGGTLWRALQEYASDSRTMTHHQALVSYQQLFYQPLFKFWMEDHRNGLSPMQAFPSLLQPELSLENQLEGQFQPPASSLKSSPASSFSPLQGLPEVPGLQPTDVPTAPGQSRLSPGAASRRQSHRRITAP